MVRVGMSDFVGDGCGEAGKVLVSAAVVCGEPQILQKRACLVSSV